MDEYKLKGYKIKCDGIEEPVFVINCYDEALYDLSSLKKG